MIPGQNEPTEKNISRKFRNLWERWRGRRELDHEIKQRKDRERVPETGDLKQTTLHSGALGTLEREFVGIINTEEVRFEALSEGLRRDQISEAEHIESWITAWRKLANGDQEKQALVDADQITYGRGCSMVGWARQYMNELPDRGDKEDAGAYVKRAGDYLKECPNPISWQHFPAYQTMFEDDEWSDNYGPAHAFYWEHRHRSDVAMEYPGTKVADADSLQDDDPWVLFVIYCNRKYCAYFVSSDVAGGPEGKPNPLYSGDADWEMLHSEEHGCNGSPFIVQYGDVKSDANYKYRYAGLFDNSLEILDAIDDALSQYGTIVRRYARAKPMVTREYGPGGQVPYGLDDDTGEPREIDWNGSEDVEQFGPGEKPGWWTPDLRAHEAIVNYHNVLAGYLQRDTLAPSAMDANSGYQLITFIQASERKLIPIVRRKRLANERMARRVFELVVEIDIDLPIFRTHEDATAAGEVKVIGGWLTLTVAQAKKARVIAQLNPRIDTAKAAGAQIAIQLGQANVNKFINVDPDWISREWLNIQNPEFHTKAARLARFLDKPEIDSWITQQVLQEVGMQLNKQQADMVQMLSQLPPADLLLIPAALRQAMQERGLIAPGLPGSSQNVNNAAPQNPGQQVGSDGGSGLNALLSMGAMPGQPSPGQNGGPGLGSPTGPLSQMLGGNAAQSAAQQGQPARPF